MNGTINELKQGLLQCANENEGIIYLAGQVDISSICKDAKNTIEKLEKENEQLKRQLTKERDILFEFVKIACGTVSEGCPGCDYCFLGEVKQKAEVFFKELAE